MRGDVWLWFWFPPAGCRWSVKTMRSSAPSSSWRTRWLSWGSSKGRRTRRTSDRTFRSHLTGIRWMDLIRLVWTTRWLLERSGSLDSKTDDVWKASVSSDGTVGSFVFSYTQIMVWNSWSIDMIDVFVACCTVSKLWWGKKILFLIQLLFFIVLIKWTFHTHCFFFQSFTCKSLSFRAAADELEANRWEQLDGLSFIPLEEQWNLKSEA